MNKKILALSLVLLLTTIYLSSISLPPVKAQSGGWITGYEIYDYTSGQHLGSVQLCDERDSNIGARFYLERSYQVTFTVNVFTAGSGDLKLATSLLNPPQGQYWELSSHKQLHFRLDLIIQSCNNCTFNWVQWNFHHDRLWQGSNPSSTDTDTSSS